MLKNQGQKQFAMAKMATYIEENMDFIYEHRPRAPKEKMLLMKSF